MNYSALGQSIGHVIDSSRIEPTLEPVDGNYNRIKMNWHVHIKNGEIRKEAYDNDFQKVIINHCFELDMVRLLGILKTKGYPFGEKDVLKAIQSHYERAMEIITNSNYDGLAELVNNSRGIVQGKDLGIL